MRKFVANGSGFCSCRERPHTFHAVRLAIALGVLLLLSAATGQSDAQTLTTLVSFNGTNGIEPTGSLTLSGSTLYGVDQSGADGAVFSIPVSGGSVRTLFSLNGTNGQDPNGGLTLSGSTFYGTTVFGGSQDRGTVFGVSVSGGTLAGSGSLTMLLLFSGTNGGTSYGNMTLSGSTLYGMTEYGGASSDGNIYSVNTDGTGFQNLLSFSGTTGGLPVGGMTLSGSTLYGATTGGGANGDGTIFTIPVGGGTLTTLCSFSGTNGTAPQGNLVLCGSTLFGMTANGGANGDGTIFSLPVSGGSLTTLLSFAGSNGSNPSLSSLTLCGSTLYGTTGRGGANNDGTVFRIRTDGTGFQSLFAFAGTSGPCLGATPYGSLTLLRSTLFGTTYSGGTKNDGTIFAVNDPSIIPPKISLSGAPSSTIITGGTAAPGVTVGNSPSATYNLNYTIVVAVLSGSATLGAITSDTGSLAPNGSQSSTVSATSTTLGVTTISFTGSDPNASNGPQTATATLTVLDHAAAAFTNSSTVLTLNFGTLQLGSGTKDLQYHFENLPAAYRADLALESVMALSDPDGVFSTDAMPFSNLAPGQTSVPLDLFLNASQLGNFSGQYQFNLSDEQDLSGWAGQQTLILNVTAEVVPEPTTLALAGAAAAGMLAFAVRKMGREG